MKFRAVMLEAVPMREFTNLVLTISKLTKECAMRISNNKIYFITTEENCRPQPPCIWCELEQSSFFSEYLMEGVDADHRDIYLGFNTGYFSKALSTLKQPTKSIKIKLTKKQCPCLTLEIESPSLNMLHMRQVTHDIPVVVIPRKDWGEYSPPPSQNYNISIEMPSLKQLKLTVDRMRNMSSDIIIKANSSGDMIFQIKNELVVVSSRAQNLQVESFNDNFDDEDDDEKRYVTCRIDIKLFANLIAANQTNFTRMLCSMIHNKLMNLYLEKEGFSTFQCYIPSIIL